MKVLVLSLVALLAAVTPGGAQSPQVAVGSRVRAYVPARYHDRDVAAVSVYHTGTVTELDSVALTVREPDGSEVRLPLDQVHELKLSGGLVTPSEARGRGARRGAAIGAGLAGGSVLLASVLVNLGNVVASEPDCIPGAPVCHDTEEHSVFRWGTALPLTAGVAVAGGAVGALAGVSLARAGREKWISVPVRSLRLQGAAGPRGGLAIALRL